jgi:hypothetical protein
MTSATLFFGLAGPAAAQQTGLVNVEIGDVTILEDVNVAVAANIVAGVCAQDINAAVAAVQIVDETGQDFTCDAARGASPEITITQDA